ncbi:hypothetical protein CYY_003514 [Polysphondylium violaceum]|uniref:Uncharacterized protein n=1 Tax=Polysphondylium violaceum TaxID=133409 RepID=A0A8J4UU90_9MYCE|nr:hypothetical protein CYY_003514 [Polysphondylium violaceum]
MGHAQLGRRSSSCKMNIKKSTTTTTTTSKSTILNESDVEDSSSSSNASDTSSDDSDDQDTSSSDDSSSDSSSDSSDSDDDVKQSRNNKKIKNNNNNKIDSNNKVYYGEKTCEKVYKDKSGKEKSCFHKAYFSINNNKSFVCGVHKGTDKLAKPLPKRDKKEAELLKDEKFKAENKVIEQHAKQNKAKNLEGRVVCSKLRMMKSPDEIEGYRKIFPNFKHGGRKDGIGMPSLSPMSLGPFNSGQPAAPIALNIENFHQGSKCFKRDLEKNGEVGATYFKGRDAFYTDKTPHRHKYMNPKTNKPEIPEFFVWVDENNKIHKLNALDCRQFYCHFYETLARQQADYQKLVELKQSGVNLQIVGYDARSIPAGEDAIRKEYNNTRAPFGHELVLYSMLTIPNPDNYPWKNKKNLVTPAILQNLSNVDEIKK